MSYDSRVVVSEESRSSESSVAAYRRYDAETDPNVSYVSSLVVHLRQVQTNLQAQHQHEKHALVELNERFRLLVDRVQQLEAQNAKFIIQVTDARRHAYGSSRIDTEWDERYLRLQSEGTVFLVGRAAHEIEYELFQMHAGLYQQLISAEPHRKDEQRVQLDAEFQQSSSVLSTLRTSYAKVGREVEILSATREDTFQQYLKLTQEWSRTRKQSKEREFSVEALRTQILFFKNISVYATV